MKTLTLTQIVGFVLLAAAVLFIAVMLNIISLHTIQWVENQPLKNPIRVTEIIDNSLVLEDGRKIIIFAESDSGFIESLNKGGRWIEIYEEEFVYYRYARYHIPVGTYGLITIPLFQYKLPKYERRSVYDYTEIIDPNNLSEIPNSYIKTN